MMKLTIRDLLWLTLVVAVGLAWFRAERRRVIELHEANARRVAAVEEWKATIADSLNRYKAVAIDPIYKEQNFVVDQLFPDDKWKYWHAHNEMMAQLRAVGADSNTPVVGQSGTPANPLP